MEAQVVTQARTLEVRRLTEVEDFKQLARVFAEIWQKDEILPVSSDVLRALAHAGNYVAGVDGEEGVCAGLMGFFALDGRRRLHLHSHILGVLPSVQRHGAGFALKQDQRAWALERGIDEISWTFDPLVRRNGFFNVGKLGADIEEYLPDFYGSMGDSINGAAASDRALAVWHLADERAVRGSAGSLPEPDIDELRHQGAVVALAESPDGTPQTASTDAAVLLVQAPADIVELRRTRPAVADAWTHALRTTMGAALAGSHRAAGMTRSGWYVLDSRSR